MSMGVKYKREVKYQGEGYEDWTLESMEILYHSASDTIEIVHKNWGYIYKNNDTPKKIIIISVSIKLERLRNY